MGGELRACPPKQLLHGFCIPVARIARRGNKVYCAGSYGAGSWISLPRPGGQSLMQRGSPEPIQLLFARIYYRFGWQAPNAEQRVAPSLRARSPARQVLGWPAQQQGCRSCGGRLHPAKLGGRMGEGGESPNQDLSPPTKSPPPWPPTVAAHSPCAGVSRLGQQAVFRAASAFAASLISSPPQQPAPSRPLPNL
ncbi:hypothetical protein NDU88_006304 [Pleurodeles waltl]|uniref:Uncharacterized protein n=1 Tax=Pleurodeles waltl TaxID=8319 RepID=A0AAV7N2M6_PLEWA|nr:hypothetical protein NDU88_006304 [Pleurodeles waltl]